MKIIEFRAENFARLKAVAITPGENPVVVLRGPNGAGKSSVLNAISSVIDGGAQLACPIRAGQHEAVVELEMSDKALAEHLTVTRKFWRATDADGIERIKDKLMVSWKEGGAGARLSPQATLDALAGGSSFDPNEFLGLKPVEQLEQLQRLVGLDFSAINAQRADVYARRTAVNKDGVGAKARLDAMPKLDAPTEQISIDALLDEQGRALAAREANDKRRREAQRALDQSGAGERQLAAKASEVSQLEALLVAARAAHGQAVVLVAALQDAAAAAKLAAAALVDPDLAEIRARIAGAENINADVRTNRGRDRLAAEVEAKRSESRELTATLAALDAEKARQLAEAKFPVTGLGFGEHGVTFNGLPFEQASGADRLRIAMAIGIAGTARLKVVRIHEASTLDARSMAIVAEMAAAAGAQVWACTVAEGACGFEIIDGEVMSPNGEIPPPPPKRARKMPPIIDGDAHE